MAGPQASRKKLPRFPALASAKKANEARRACQLANPKSTSPPMSMTSFTPAQRSPSFRKMARTKLNWKKLIFRPCPMPGYRTGCVSRPVVPSGRWVISMSTILMRMTLPIVLCLTGCSSISLLMMTALSFPMSYLPTPISSLVVVSFAAMTSRRVVQRVASVPGLLSPALAGISAITMPGGSAPIPCTRT